MPTTLSAWDMVSVTTEPAKLARYKLFDPATGGGPESAAAWYQRNAEPAYTCTHEERLGPAGEGGKWLCHPEKLKRSPTCLVYSIGNMNDFRWESAVLEIAPHCEIHVFDHTVPDPTNKPVPVHFHRWGLSASTHVEKSLFSLTDIVKKLKHEGRAVDIFKIDCEGCEWETFETWFNAEVYIREVLVEVHGGTAQPKPDPIAKTFMQFMWNMSMLIYHKEPNVMFSQGEGLCVEFAFIHVPSSRFD